MINAAILIEALQAYRRQLLDRGHALKAAAVAQCIVIVRRIAASDGR
jgi:hypothetical protein